MSTKTCVTGNNFILHKALIWLDWISKATYLKSCCVMNSTMMSFSGWICSILRMRHKNGAGVMLPPYTPPMYFNCIALSTSNSAETNTIDNYLYEHVMNSVRTRYLYWILRNYSMEPHKNIHRHNIIYPWFLLNNCFFKHQQHIFTFTCYCPFTIMFSKSLVVELFYG